MAVSSDAGPPSSHAGPPSSDAGPWGVVLVGAGVVGQAILKAHLDARVPLWLVDQQPDAVRGALAAIDSTEPHQITEIALIAEDLWGCRIMPSDVKAGTAPSQTLVIESIVERLDVKQAFFQRAERLFGDDAVLCSNTSTLRIGNIAAALRRPQRFCGMHFFMPVGQRRAVEVVAGEHTAASTLQQCVDHVHRIDKQPLQAPDGPGFLVNRLLCPYLNAAISLLARGVGGAQIERAAIAYGMPMSPLELVDWIGTRTAFDAGRVFWQSFPERMDPSPILPALVKQQRFGRACGKGFYDYEGSRRSEDLAAETRAIVKRYLRDCREYHDDEVVRILSVSMWIEAACLVDEGAVSDVGLLEAAVEGGLGYQRPGDWLAFFQRMDSQELRDTLIPRDDEPPALPCPAHIQRQLLQGCDRS